MKFKSIIEDKAESASKVITHDTERQKIFVEGAKFAIETLARCVMPDHWDTMMGKGSLEYVNKLRLKDVLDALEMLQQSVKSEDV